MAEPIAGASLQFSDIVIVSCDARGFSLARSLALRGWKTVVVELDGGALTKSLDWADRLGPMLAWELEGHEEIDSDGRPIRSHYASLWLPTAPVALGGRLADVGLEHLKVGYGIDSARTQWPMAAFRSAVAARLKRREKFMGVDAAEDLSVPLETPIKSINRADAVALSRRDQALAAGVRILDAEQIVDVRLSDQVIDRVEFKTAQGALVERTRSLVWMLSEEESKRAEFVGAGVPLESFFNPGAVDPYMAWWRTRFALRGLKNTAARMLTRLPEVPPFVMLLGTVDRPWTHANLILMELVEQSPTLKVFDAWIRVPYWSRADHVYRDEQRLLMQSTLRDRFSGCELVWVTPSPLALTEPAVRLPQIVYSESTVPASGRLRNICFAGPETWTGIGLLGLRSMEPGWISQLEKMRREWDPAARVKSNPVARLSQAWSKAQSQRATKRREPSP